MWHPSWVEVLITVHIIKLPYPQMKVTRTRKFRYCTLHVTCGAAHTCSECSQCIHIFVFMWPTFIYQIIYIALHWCIGSYMSTYMIMILITILLLLVFCSSLVLQININYNFINDQLDIFDENTRTLINIKGDTVRGTIRKCCPYLILDKSWWAHIILFHNDLQQYNEIVT